MSRKKAREIALHLIFEMGFKEFEAEQVLAKRLDEKIMKSISGDIQLYAGELSQEQKAYITTTVTGVAVHIQEIDELIAKYSKNWDVKRLSRISVAIMRLAIFEMKYVEDVPVGVSINEAVEFTKSYDSKEAASFVNGILGSISREEL